MWRALHRHKSIDVTYISEAPEALGSEADCMHAASALDVSCLDLQDTSRIYSLSQFLRYIFHHLTAM